MLVKSVLLFLLAMALIAMIGSALFPKRFKAIRKKHLGIAKPLVCSRCNRYQSACSCKKG